MIMLKNGTGAVYSAIFDKDGKPVIDELLGKPIGLFVTKFSYTFDEDEVDEGTIVLSCSNPNLPDNKKLSYRSLLQVQWGWLLPDGNKIISPLKKVMVKKRKTSYTNTGVDMTISISCPTSLTKSTPPSYKDSTSDFTSFINSLLNGDPAVEILDYETSTEYKTGIIYERVP